jgi:hypothetical protein
VLASDGYSVAFSVLQKASDVNTLFGCFPFWLGASAEPKILNCQDERC